MDLVDVVGPREGRTPTDYADLILSAAHRALSDLSLVKNDDDFTEKFVNPMVAVVRKGDGGDELYRRFSDPSNGPAGKQVDVHQFWATVTIAYALQAIFADEAGDAAKAWTFTTDGALAVGALLSAVSDHKFFLLGRRAPAKAGAYAKLAKDPVQAAKAEAYKLWQERHAGKHPSLRTNEQFATECLRKWPALTSSRVITGWCTEWNKTARESQSAS